MPQKTIIKIFKFCNYPIFFRKKTAGTNVEDMDVSLKLSTIGHRLPESKEAFSASTTHLLEPGNKCDLYVFNSTLIRFYAKTFFSENGSFGVVAKIGYGRSSVVWLMVDLKEKNLKVVKMLKKKTKILETEHHVGF